MRKANADKPKPVKEPAERTIHRATCKHFGYCGNCMKKSGVFGIGGTYGHITMGCDGDCRRMKLWDTKHGYKGVEFKTKEIY